MGKGVGLETERQRISAYLHDRLAPGLLAVTFSIEAVREQSEQEKHSAESSSRNSAVTLANSSAQCPNF
jgi:signal transduction histidine kinase